MASNKIAIIFCLFLFICLIKENFAGEGTPCNEDTESQNVLYDVYLFCYGSEDPCNVNEYSTLIQHFRLNNTDIHHLSKANCTFYFEGYDNSTYETIVKHGYGEVEYSGKDISSEKSLFLKMWVFGDPLEGKEIPDKTDGKLICVVDGYKQEDEDGDKEQFCMSSPIYYEEVKEEED